MYRCWFSQSKSYKQTPEIYIIDRGEMLNLTSVLIEGYGGVSSISGIPRNKNESRTHGNSQYIITFPSVLLFTMRCVNTCTISHNYILWQRVKLYIYKRLSISTCTVPCMQIAFLRQWSWLVVYMVVLICMALNANIFWFINYCMYVQNWILCWMDLD